MYRLKYYVILLLILTLISFPLTAYADLFTWSINTVETTATVAPEQIADNNFLDLEAGSAILIEQNSGTMLYGYNVHERLHPASVTKVMSLLLIMEALDSGKITLETQIPCSDNAAKMGGSQIWLDTTETLSVNDMLKAICVVSANDYDVQK